jgi:hypothetical protein
MKNSLCIDQKENQGKEKMKLESIPVHAQVSSMVDELMRDLEAVHGSAGKYNAAISIMQSQLSSLIYYLQKTSPNTYDVALSYAGIDLDHKKSA